MKRTVFFLSDHTGLTAEAMGRSLLSQFQGLVCECIHLPFLDSPGKVADVVEEIDRVAVEDGARPLVFSSFVNAEYRRKLQQSSAQVFDFFSTYTGILEQELQTEASGTAGQYHGIGQRKHYEARIHAVNFALANDDGGKTRDYRVADVVLLGVSRSGKTPTCLYLGLQFGILAANYPITDSDLEREGSDFYFLNYRKKLFGLTIDPLQLQRIRRERRSTGRYAELARCKREVGETEALFRHFRIPYLDTTAMSVEEIAASIMHRSGLVSRVG